MSNQNCPGTSSESAGKSKACEGCPNKTYCDQPKTTDPDIEQIHNNIKNIPNIFAIMSGKGGVGKSIMTRNIAQHLSENSKTLILDFDLTGPSIPKLTNTEDALVYESNNRLYPVQVSENLYCISVGHFVKEKTQIMNSSYKTHVIKKILKEMDFSGFVFVVIDTPPGVSDEHLGIVNMMAVDQAILVTTPQKVSFNDVVRQIDFCRKTKISIFGVIENMKKFVCGECNYSNHVFSSCGVKEFCDKMQIRYLGEVDLNPIIAKNSDKGMCFVDECIRNTAQKIILESKKA